MQYKLNICKCNPNLLLFDELRYCKPIQIWWLQMLIINFNVQHLKMFAQNILGIQYLSCALLCNELQYSSNTLILS